MQNEDEQLKKTTGGGEKVTWSGKAWLWSSVEGGSDSGGVFLPSLLSSPLLCFSSQSLLCLSLFPLSDLLLFFLFSSTGVGRVNGGRNGGGSWEAR